MSSIVKWLEWWMRARLKRINGRSWSTKGNEHRPYLIVSGIARAKKKVTQFRLSNYVLSEEDYVWKLLP